MGRGKFSENCFFITTQILFYLINQSEEKQFTQKL